MALCKDNVESALVGPRMLRIRRMWRLALAKRQRAELLGVNDEPAVSPISACHELPWPMPMFRYVGAAGLGQMRNEEHIHGTYLPFDAQATLALAQKRLKSLAATTPRPKSLQQVASPGYFGQETHPKNASSHCFLRFTAAAAAPPASACSCGGDWRRLRANTPPSSYPGRGSQKLGEPQKVAALVRAPWLSDHWAQACWCSWLRGG